MEKRSHYILVNTLVRHITSVICYKKYKKDRSYTKRYRLKDGTNVYIKREGKVEFKRSFIYASNERQAAKFTERKTKEFKKSKYDTISTAVQSFQGRIRSYKKGTIVGKVGKIEKMYAVSKKKAKVIGIRNEMITNLSIAADDLKTGTLVYLRAKKEVRRKL